MIAAPLLVLVSLVQTQAPLAGEVVDAKGHPVPGAEVALAAGPTREGVVPILARARTDGSGRFHLPRLAPETLRGVDTTGTIWAYKPGLGLGMVDLLRDDRREQVHRLVLEAEAPRRVTIRDSRGQPVAGARVTPRTVQTERTSYLGIVIPDAWLDRLSAVTDARGTTSLP
jgi:hypothetical protein